MNEYSLRPTQSAAIDSQQQDLRKRAMNLYIQYIPRALETGKFSPYLIIPCYYFFQSEVGELKSETGAYASWKSRQRLTVNQIQRLGEIEQEIYRLEEDFPLRSEEHRDLRRKMCGLLSSAMNALDCLHARIYMREYEGKKYKDSYQKVASDYNGETELLASRWKETLGSLTRSFTEVSETDVDVSVAAMQRKMQTILEIALKQDEMTFYNHGLPGDYGECECIKRQCDGGFDLLTLPPA